MPATPLPIPGLRRALLAWFERNQRAMPWRSRHPARPDPWAVLVSEIMLQQTQVATVIPYFTRFMAAFPTPAALAAASEQEVLARWQGLGYYRRARLLQGAAKEIAARHGGAVPATRAELLELPGLGPYTAGAVASIAFGEPVGVVDGNVARVGSRLLATRRDPAGPAGKQALWALADALADHPRAGCLNQALMELGATVCTPANPRCEACPLAAHCRARAAGRPRAFPVTAKKTKVKEVVFRMLWLERGGRVLLSPRPAGGLWGGMWELPTLEDAAADPADAVSGRFGLASGPWERAGAFTHLLTHRRIRFELWKSSVRTGNLRPGSGAFRHPQDTADLPIPTPHRRVLAAS